MVAFVMMDKYGGFPTIKKVVEALFEEVGEKRDLRHYFFNIKLENLIRDQKLFHAYSMRKPDRFYREQLMQTANSDIQVSVSVFDEVLLCLIDILRQHDVDKDEAVRIAVHLIEIMEETRSQAGDTVVTVWKPVDINNQLINNFYNNNRTDSRIEKNGDVYATRNFPHPFWTRVALDKKQITFIAQAFAQDSTTLEQVEQLAIKANQRVGILNLEAVEGPKGPVLFARHVLPFEHGVPTRLLLRAAHQFSRGFETGLNADKEELMKKVLK
jgi:hemoglobin